MYPYPDINVTGSRVNFPSAKLLKALRECNTLLQALIDCASGSFHFTLLAASGLSAFGYQQNAARHRQDVHPIYIWLSTGARAPPKH